MKKHRTFFYWSCCIVPLFALMLASPLFAEDEGATAKALVEKKCSICHSVDRAYEAKKTHTEWERTVEKMIRYSDQMNFLNQKEKETIIDFLAQQKAPQADTK